MKTVLIADGERSIRKALELLFVSRGDFVFMAKTAENALSILKTADPDIIIYDMQLSGISPADFARIAKNSDSSRLIFTSLYPEWPKIETIKKTANCHYLEKPFAIKDLTKLLPESASGKIRFAC